MMKMLLKLKYGFLNFTLYYLLFLKLVDANAENKQIFINYNDLKVGKETSIYFGGQFGSKIPSFLPKEKAELIPFSSKKLPFLLNYFGFIPKSPQAQAVEFTLKHCENKPKISEVSICATSLDSMFDFASKIFKNDDEFLKVLSTSKLPKSTKKLQKYVIVNNPQQIQNPNIVECHMMVYPYAVYECYRYEEPDYKVFQISLRGEDGVYVEAMVNCHMNTSNWDPNDGALRLLGLKPGSSPICQFLPSTDLVWVPASNQHVD